MGKLPYATTKSAYEKYKEMGVDMDATAGTTLSKNKSSSGDSSFKSSLAKYQAKAPTSSLSKYTGKTAQYTENGAEIIGEYEPLTNAPKRTLWDDVKAGYKHIGQTGAGFLTIAMSLADRVATRVEQAAYVIGEDMKDGNPFNAISDEERAERQKTLDAMEYRTQDVTSSLGKFRSTIQNKQDKDRQDMSQMGQGAQLVVGAIESLPNTVVSLIPYAGMAINGVASYDQAMDSLYNDMQATGVEIPADKARLYALGVAAVEAGSEMMFPAGSATAKGVSTLLTKAPAKGLLGRAAQRLATYLAKDAAGDIIIPTVGRQLKSLAIEAAQEGAEEVVSSIGQGLLAEALIHPEKKLFGWDDANINAKDALLSFAGGALAGGMFSGVMGLAYYPKARAFVESKSGVKISQMTEADIEGFLKAAREDFKSPDAQAELTDQLTRNLALSTSTGQFVTDPKTGAVYRVSAPDPETGMVMLFGSDGQQDITVTQEQLAQNFTAPASAVTDSSLPVTDGSSPAAGVAPNIIERQTATGETVPMFTETLPDGGTVTAEATGKSVLLTVAPKTGAPYSFEVDAEEYSRAMATGNPLPALLAASGRNKEQGNLGRYIARNGLSKSAQGVWTAVDRATRSAFDDRVSRTKAEAEAKETAKQTEEVKQAEKELEEAKTAGEKTQVKTKTKALRDKARKVQETAVKKGQMAERHLKALLKMDQQNEAQGFDTYYNILPEGRQSALQKKLSKIVAAANGKEVIWIYNAAGEDAIDGFVAGETDSTVYINADVKTNALQTIGHELFHQARKAGLTKAFEQAVLASTKMTKDQLIQAYADKYASQADYFDYLQANPEIALEEALADKAGEVFSTPEFLQKFAERAGQTKFDAFIKKVKDWLQKIRDVAPEEVDTLLEALTAKVEAKNDLGVNAETQQIMDEHGYDPGKFAVRPQFEESFKGLVDIIKDSDKSVTAEQAATRAEQLAQVARVSASLFDEISQRRPDVWQRMIMETPKTKYGPIRTNTGGYVYTFDLDTLCTRVLMYRAMVDKLTEELGYFPEEKDLTAMLMSMRENGDMIPCIYCYVESKRRLWNDSTNVIFNAKASVIEALRTNPKLSHDEALKKFAPLMYGYTEGKSLSAGAKTLFQQWYQQARAGLTVRADKQAMFAGAMATKREICDRLTELTKGRTDSKHLNAALDVLADEYGIVAKSTKDSTTPGRTGPNSDAWRMIASIADEWMYAQTTKEPINFYGAEERAYSTAEKLFFLQSMREASDYANAASSAKGVESYEHYTDQLKAITSLEKIEMNAHGGFRIHSSNDFRIDHAMDYILFITHLAADKRGGQGWKSHMYTKSVECARFLAHTGIKINCSVAFTTKIVNGKKTIILNTREGMDMKDVLQLREISNHIGSMAMTVDDDQFLYCLEHDWIDQIIPFHMSGMKKVVWSDILGWNDYTKVQNDAVPTKEYLRHELLEAGYIPDAKTAKWFDKRKPDGKLGASVGAFQQLHDRYVVGARDGVKVLWHLNDDKKWVRYIPGFLPFNQVLESAYFRVPVGARAPQPGDKVVNGYVYYPAINGMHTVEKNGKTKEIEVWHLPGWFSQDRDDAANVQEYFRLCREYNVMPRFWDYMIRADGRDPVRPTEHPGYIKLIKEYSRTNTPQIDIRAQFTDPNDSSQTLESVLRAMAQDFEDRGAGTHAPGGYNSLTKLAPGKMESHMRKYYDKVDGKWVFKEEYNPLLTDLINLMATGGADLSRLSPELRVANKQALARYTDKKTGEPTAETKMLIDKLLRNMPMEQKYMTGLASVAEYAAFKRNEQLVAENKLDRDAFYKLYPSEYEGMEATYDKHYLHPADAYLKELNDQATLDNLRKPGTFVSLEQAPLSSLTSTPERMEIALNHLRAMSNDKSMFVTNKQKLAMITQLLDVVDFTAEIQSVLRGEGLLYSVRTGVSAKASKMPPGIKTLFDPLARHKGVEFVDPYGEPVQDIHQVAAIAMTFRDPRIEHRNIIYAKNGKVVHSSHWTSHMPDSVTGYNFEPEDQAPGVNAIQSAADRIKRTAAFLGADQIFFTHNHPSGNPVPSTADRAMDKLNRETFGSLYGGEVITDHNEYIAIDTFDGAPIDVRGFFGPSRQGTNYNKNLQKFDKLFEDKSLPNFITEPGDITLAFVDTQERLTGLQTLPLSFATDRQVFADHVKRAKAQFRGAIVYAFTEDFDALPMSEFLVNENLVDDLLVYNKESLDSFGGEVGGIPAFTSPFSQWLFAMHEKDPNKKRAAQEWDALITKAPFKSSYEYEFLGIKDWLLQQKSVTAGELFDYYQDHAGMMTESVYENPNQWSEYSPSQEFPYNRDDVEWSNYRASVITMDPNAVPFEFSNADSRAHFPAAKSVMLHTRMEDVVTPGFPNGATYLVEVQSDLHSEGQKKGYDRKGAYDAAINERDSFKTKVAEFTNTSLKPLKNAVNRAWTDIASYLENDAPKFETDPETILSADLKFGSAMASTVLAWIKRKNYDVFSATRTMRQWVETVSTGDEDALRRKLEDALISDWASDRSEMVLLLARFAGVNVKVHDSGYLYAPDGVTDADVIDTLVSYIGDNWRSMIQYIENLNKLSDSYGVFLYDNEGIRSSKFVLSQFYNMEKEWSFEETTDTAELRSSFGNFAYAFDQIRYASETGSLEALTQLVPSLADVLSYFETVSGEVNAIEDLSQSIGDPSREININPEVPFGKDYMLLGFKTALRDAVNAGHDAVMWAGWMHAKRWRVEGNLIYAKVLEKRDTGITLEYQTAGMSSPEIKSFVLDLGSANGLNMEPEFGVENAAKLRASKTGNTVFGQSRTALLGMGVQRHPDTDEIIEDAGPTFGKMYNNMIPRMYDEELVSQVKKYAKQWGVEPKYEQVEGLPGYQWVFPITQPVRDAVRSGPQVAYSVRAQRSFSRAYAEEFLSKGTLARITEAHLFYDIQPNRVTMAAAAAILHSGRAKAEALARNVNAFRDSASTALRIYFMLEADLQGNHEAAAEWALIAAQAGTTLGQAVQAYAMLRKLSAGSLQLLTARKLNQLLSQDDRDQVDRVSAGILNQLNAIDQNKVDEMLAKARLEDLKRLIETEEGRAEALQQRLAKLESDLLYYENDPVRQYVEALHDIAAATVPYQDMYQGSDLRGFIKWAIDHPGLTSRMWELAHDTLHNLHYADSSFMEQIEGYFGDYLPKRRRNGLKLTRRSYEEIIAAIKEHFAAEDHTANALIARLKELGVDPADATLIAHSMTEQLAKLTKRQKLNSLTRLLPVMRRGGRSTRDKLERMVNLANEIGVNEATVKANIANLMGLPGLTPELQAELSQIAKDIGAIQANARKQARAMTEEESRMVDFKMAILLARIQQQKPARVGDKIENFRYMMMLSWIKPAERNIIGNALFLFTDTIKDTAAATLDIAASKALGINRAIPYPDLKKAFQGMLKGARYGAEDIKAGVNTSELDTQYSINQGQMYRSKTMQTLTAIYRFKMALPDRIAQTAAYESHLAGLKRLNDNRKPEERMSAEDLHEQALLFAAKKTFTDDNIISKTFSELRASLNLLSTLGHTTRWGLGSVLLPFTKVPGALLMRTLEYSPLSVGRAVAYLVKHTHAVGWRGEGKAEWHKKYQKKFSTALADAGWGTLTTLVLGAFLRSIGVITGEPPEDSQEYNLRKVMGVGRGYLLNWSALRRCFANGFDAEAAAWQDGDFLSTYSWLAPMSLGMSIGANWWDLRQTLTGKDGTYYGSWASELLLAVASGTQSIMDLSMMQGVAQLMDTGYASNFRFTPEGETQRPFYLENFLNVAVSYPSSFVPNELKMLREAIDNTQRNVYDQNYLRYAYWLVLNKLPGASKLLAPKYDVLGNELKVYHTSGWKRYLDLAVNPALTNKLILDENAMLVMDVYLNKTVDDSVRLPTAKRYLVKSEMVNGQKIETKVPLTAKEQAELQRVIGTRIDEAISRVPRNISVDAQAAQIHDIISKESKRAIAELLAWKEMQSGG